MNLKPTKIDLEAFVAHTIDVLPDSLDARKTVLATLLALLPQRAEAQRQQVKTLMESLRAHEHAQLEFSGMGKGDGDGR